MHALYTLYDHAVSLLQTPHNVCTIGPDQLQRELPEESSESSGLDNELLDKAPEGPAKRMLIDLQDYNDPDKALLSTALGTTDILAGGEIQRS